MPPSMWLKERPLKLVSALRHFAAAFFPEIEEMCNEFRLLHFLLNYFFDAGAKILQHHCRCVSPGRTGDRTSRKCSGACLIQARDGHAMLRPARYRAHCAGLCRARCASVNTAMPEMRVHALEVEGAFHKPGKDLIVGQIWREAPQIIQVRIRNLVLDFIRSEER